MSITDKFNFVSQSARIAVAVRFIAFLATRGEKDKASISDATLSAMPSLGTDGFEDAWQLAHPAPMSWE